MDHANPPTPDPAIFDRNLSALRGSDPGLAERIANAPGIACAPPVAAIARDGRLNFRLPRPDGRFDWFGRTSIPSVRAAALLEQFQAGEANVLLPGIGQGSEAALLGQRFGRHRAVFVWELSETPVQLALRLHDLAGPIADERVVFLICCPDELGRTLINWLDAHPGHLCPNRLMMWPWQTLAELNSCRAAVEAAHQETERRRQHRLAEVHERLNAACPGPDTHAAVAQVDQPTVALLALHANPDTWALTDALAAGASTLGWPAVQIDVRGPADVHPLARASRLLDAPEGKPDLAILIDLTRHEVRNVLPDPVPAVCWLGPQAAADPTLASRAAGGGPIAVTSTRLLERAVAAGIHRTRLAVCPLPCLASRHAAEPEQDANRPIDVVLFADVGPTDAASFGFGLTSHIQIWASAVDLIQARIASLSDDQIEPLLARAEAKVKARIDEPDARQAAIDVLSSRVVPTLLARSIAQVLVSNGISVTIHGAGWPEGTGAHLAGPAGSPARCEQVLRRAKIMIHADVAGGVPAHALLAAGCGAVLLARSHRRDGQPGGLHTLLEPGEEICTFSGPRDLVSTVTSLLDDPGRRRHLTERARRRCQSDHTPAHRLQALWAVATSFATES